MALLVKVSAGFWILVALSILLLPIQWIAAAVSAAWFHEMCHISAVWLLGGDVQNLTLRSGGAEIRLSGLTQGRELAAAAAGPVGSLFLSLLLPIAPRLAVCGMIQGLFNLLPIYPMDGGRILYCFFSILSGAERGRHMADYIGKFTCLLLAVLGIIGSLPGNYGITPGLVSLGILMKSQNIPCQKSFQAVQ